MLENNGQAGDSARPHACRFDEGQQRASAVRYLEEEAKEARLRWFRQTSPEDKQGSQGKDTEVGTGGEKDYSRIMDLVGEREVDAEA